MSWAGIAVRLGILLGAVLLATWVSVEVREALDIMVMPDNEVMVHRSIMLGTLVYILLLAVPFVPGAEIDLTMLTVFGAPIAPLVYGATVAALMLAYTIGRIVPTPAVVRAMRLVRLDRAAQAVEEMAPLSRDERISRMVQGGSPRLVKFATRHRYLAVMLAVNTPGNVLIGGGGGIALMAGMSRLFSPLPFLAAVAVAVSPVPLAIAVFGATL